MILTSRRVAGVSLLLAAHLVPSAALAQSVSEAESASVANRVRVGIDPQGLTLGSFRAFLNVGVSTGYNDNIYNRRDPKVSDGYIELKPSISISSLWNRGFLSMTANSEHQRYFDRTSEDSDQFDVALTGRYDLSDDLKVSANGSIGRHIEPRGTAGDLFLPGGPNTYYQRSFGSTVTATPNRILFELGATASHFTYLDGEGPSGRVDLSYRDFTSYGSHARLGYELGPGLYGFSYGSVSFSRYPADGGAARGSNTYSVGAGVQLGRGDIVGGQVSLGYVNVNFKSLLYSDVHGLGYSADIFWNPTTLLSLDLKVGRQLERAPVVNSAGIDQSVVTAQANYELLRTLIVTVIATYTHSDFRGIGRTEDRFSQTVTARYTLNRFVELTGSVNFRQQTATVLERRYGGESFQLGGILRY